MISRFGKERHYDTLFSRDEHLAEIKNYQTVVDRLLSFPVGLSFDFIRENQVRIQFMDVKGMVLLEYSIEPVGDDTSYLYVFDEGGIQPYFSILISNELREVMSDAEYTETGEYQTGSVQNAGIENVPKILELMSESRSVKVVI